MEKSQMNHVWEENHIAFSQESKLEESQIRKQESERLIDKYPNKQHHRIDLIYVGAKLVCGKIAVPLKTTDRMSKPGWELRLESQLV